jgi:hypothetical protein
VATPTIREVVHTATSGVNCTVTTGAGTAVDDILICFAGSDFYDAATFGAPTGTAGAWTQIATTADLGVNNSHLKVWWRKVTVGGAQTVTVSPHPDEDNWNTTYVITGADTTSPIDDAVSAATDPGASANHVCPAVSPTTSDALLLTGLYTQVFSLTNYTAPGGVTKQNEDDNSSTGASGSKVLSASGSTGTFTWVADIVNCKFVACTVAVKGASAVVPAAGIGPSTLGPGRVSPTGRWSPLKYPGTLTATAYTVSLDGAVTSAGVLTRSTSKALAGTVTSAGSLTKLAAKAFAGTVASSGALAKLAAKAFAGTVASLGALAKLVAKALAGTVTSAGSLAMLKVALKTLTGSIAASGALTRSTSKALAGSTTPAGSLAKLAARALTGTITSNGALAKKPIKAVTSTIALSGSLTRQTAKVLAGTLTTAGSLTKLVAKGLAGTISAAGSLATSGGGSAATVNATSTSTITARRTSTSTITAARTSTPSVTGKATSTTSVTDG